MGASSILPMISFTSSLVFPRVRHATRTVMAWLIPIERSGRLFDIERQRERPFQPIEVREREKLIWGRSAHGGSSIARR